MIKPVNPKVNQLTQLRNNVFYSVIEGNYKKYKTAAKECAKYTFENYELAKETKAPQIKAPLFSKIGLNMMKIWFLNLFRKKTLEEKALRKMHKEESLRADADKFIGK